MNECYKYYRQQAAIKKASRTIWLIAGVLACIAFGTVLGHSTGYDKGASYATECITQGGVLLHDSKQYFCWFE